MHFYIEPEKRNKLLLIIAAVLAAILLVLGGVMIALGDGDGKVSVPEGELLVEDIYEGEVLIPDFDLKRNTYDKKKFVTKDGFLTYDSPSARLGVDVSEYQGDVNWEQVKEAGIDFAIVRLGWRGSTQGMMNVDSKFERNFAGATDAGLFAGVYFFSQAVSVEEAEAEADFVIETLNGRKLAYPVVFDWEQPRATDETPAKDLRAYNVKGRDATAFAKAFCERIKAAGYTPCVYTNKYMAYDFFNLGELSPYDLWYAEYQSAPSLYYDFRIWQYTEEGRVPGIEGGVDINVCFRPY